MQTLAEPSPHAPRSSFKPDYRGLTISSSNTSHWVSININICSRDINEIKNLKQITEFKNKAWRNVELI